jgi:anti-sigma-K factor RskA
VLATTRLDTLDTGVQEGTATLVQAAGGVELRVATSPFSAGTGYLEVWLINTDGKRMVSVGVLSNGTSGTFPVARGLIDAGYLIVDVSRERLDDKPQHSGDSVVRGKLSL